MKKLLCGVLAMCLTLNGFGAVTSKDASKYTKEKNDAVLKQLPFADTKDFEEASKGLIAPANPIIMGAKGNTTVDISKYSFYKGERPDTMNPSLWRIGQINNIYGLFKVTDGMYQVRGIDISNMTIIEGKKGLIIIDPLMTTETAKAGLDLYYENTLKAGQVKKPVTAVIYSHSHTDHYGGVKGVTSDEDVKTGKTKIIAPDGFLAEAVSENVFAGNAMGRRTQYQYGPLLPVGPKGQAGAGLGQITPVGGTVSLIAPTDIITKKVEKRTVDGVKIEFVLVPGTEAPSEMFMYFPDLKVLNSAEDATHTLHNLYTLRGAKVRDADKWWKAIDTMMSMYGDKFEIIIAQHHWPKWGNKEINAYLSNHRDAYKYIHDQTLFYMNHGYKKEEIGDMLAFPKALDQDWALRGYYGSLNHDAKAVYQFYLGWYDSNPVNLHPLPQTDGAKEYVRYMGGANNIIKNAKADFNKGSYRFAAEALGHVVMAEPKNSEARYLLADILEQLGYQQEDPTWRNEYLVGAFELRHGVPEIAAIDLLSPDTMRAMTPEMMLQLAGIRLDAKKAEGKKAVFNFNFKNGKAQTDFMVNFQNSVLVYREGAQAAKADATISGDENAIKEVLSGILNLDDAIKNGSITVTGNKGAFDDVLSMLVKFDPMFNIMTPIGSSKNYK